MADSPDRYERPLRDRPLMPHVHNIAGKHRGELGPSDEELHEVDQRADTQQT